LIENKLIESSLVPSCITNKTLGHKLIRTLSIRWKSIAIPAIITWMPIKIYIMISCKKQFKCMSKKEISKSTSLRRIVSSIKEVWEIKDLLWSTKPTWHHLSSVSMENSMLISISKWQWRKMIMWRGTMMVGKLSLNPQTNTYRDNIIRLSRQIKLYRIKWDRKKLSGLMNLKRKMRKTWHSKS
jgi:hypothetical protein